jgi:Ca2+-binding EF-hand superfamily protein
MRTVFGGFVAIAGLMALPSVVTAEDQPDAGELFAQLDANKDGQVTREEVPDEKQRLFDRLVRKSDNDGNGQLNSDELAAGLANKRPERPLKEKSEGGDNRPEGGRPFGDAFAQGPPGRPLGDRPEGSPRGGRHEGPPDPEEIFEHIDANDDGTISKDEFVQHHRQMTERFRDRRPGGPEDRPRREGRPDRPDRERGEGPPRPEGPPRDREDGPPRDRERRGFGPGGPGQNPDELFSRLDKNGDGKLTADEAAEKGKERFDRMLSRQDKDGDKAISKEEFMEGHRRRKERFSREEKHHDSQRDDD